MRAFNFKDTYKRFIHKRCFAPSRLSFSKAPSSFRSKIPCSKSHTRRNYYDAFPLADDIMEPYRPFIDQIAYKDLQPFRQHQGSEKMTQIAGFYPIFLIFSTSNRLRTRIK